MDPSFSRNTLLFLANLFIVYFENDRSEGMLSNGQPTDFVDVFLPLNVLVAYPIFLLSGFIYFVGSFLERLRAFEGGCKLHTQVHTCG